MKKYKLIYADPAWSYDNKNVGEKGEGGASHIYDCMTLQEIKDLPINEIADKDCVLFLWGTIPMLPEALEVLNSWGFKYKTSLFWNKTPYLGMGYWFRNNVEILLVGVKGKVKAFGSNQANIIHYKVRQHSSKPPQFYTIIESLGLQPKVELFARTRRQGWDVWGNQVPNHTQMLLHNICPKGAFNRNLKEDSAESSQIFLDRKTSLNSDIKSNRKELLQ
jgi:N6-adenosine-specific RNA methylase IME4